MTPEKLAKCGKVVFVVGLLNFLVFMVAALALGGDAVNGHESAGKYYLANHGRLTEVSRAVFLYSRMHAYSLFVTHPLALLGAAAFSVTEAKKN